MTIEYAVRNRVRDLRIRLKLRQEDLTNEAGVTRQTIIAIEKGRLNPSIQVCLKLARILREPVDYVFYLATAKEAAVEAPAAPADEPLVEDDQDEVGPVGVDAILDSEPLVADDDEDIGFDPAEGLSPVEAGAGAEEALEAAVDEPVAAPAEVRESYEEYSAPDETEPPPSDEITTEDDDGQPGEDDISFDKKGQGSFGF
ncbi:MAG: helix-turn-helix transcriptional regulator [Candidatus Hydrogenedentes bacterium]|nr:helix-turn-helix transcriptional regulator [Candidatus Hydrogenedentota bacterium]